MIWGGYPRISEDPSDTRAGIGRQIEDITAAVVARGGKPEEIVWFTENDTSAYKKRRLSLTDPVGNTYIGYRVIRPVWHGALQALRQGEVGGLMVWDLDRLARDPRDLEDAIEVVQYYRGRVEGSVHGSIDLSTDSGVAMARVLVAMASKSSADTGRRVARAHLANARSGKPVGGFRPFGWQDDKATLDPAEAKMARDAIDRLLAGASMRSIVREWNEVGVKTTAGKEWSQQALRQYLRSPRLVGHRTHQRKVLLDDQGAPVRGLWEPLIDEDRFEALTALLGRPERRVRVPRRGARTHLMTGLLRCGRCSSVMYGHNREYKGGSRHYYVCRDNGHVLSGSGVAIDEAIRDLLLAYLEDWQAEVPAEGYAGDARIAQVKGQIEELMGAFTAGTLSGEIVFPRVQVLEQELGEMQNGRSLWLAENLGPAVRRLTLREWEAMEVDEQRAYAEKLLDAVLLKPPTRKGNLFEYERLVPVWRRPAGPGLDGPAG